MVKFEMSCKNTWLIYTKKQIASKINNYLENKSYMFLNISS